MKIDKKGVWRRFEGDSLCHIWFWNKPIGKIYSEKYNQNFSTFNDYLKFVGSTRASIKSGSIMGFSNNDIILDWVRYKFSNEIVVVLTELNLTKKSSSFWDSIPYDKKVVFGKDVVVLRCKDLSQAKILVDSITPSFAEAFAFRDGELCYWSSDDYTGH